MKNSKLIKRSLFSKKSIGIASIVLVVSGSFLAIAPNTYAAPSVSLGTADSFAVLAGSGITNTGTTTITGDVGTHPTGTFTGATSATITGTIHIADATALSAKNAALAAFNNAAGQVTTGAIAADLGGQTLTPGVYTSASSIGLTGTLTLNAGGDANAVFIFKAGST